MNLERGARCYFVGDAQTPLGLARYQGDMNEPNNSIGNSHWLDRQNVNCRSFHLSDWWAVDWKQRDDSLFHARRARSIGRKYDDDQVLSYGTHKLSFADALHRASLEYRTPTTHEQRQLIFVSLCIYVSNDNDNFSALYGAEYIV